MNSPIRPTCAVYFKCTLVKLKRRQKQNIGFVEFTTLKFLAKFIEIILKTLKSAYLGFEHFGESFGGRNWRIESKLWLVLSGSVTIDRLSTFVNLILVPSLALESETGSSFSRHNSRTPSFDHNETFWLVSRHNSANNCQLWLTWPTVFKVVSVELKGSFS